MADNAIGFTNSTGSIGADTFIPPGCGGYTPTSRRLSHDPARARELLAEAGFAGGKGVPSLQIGRAHV